MILDVLSIGDASENIFLELDEVSVHCEKGTSKCTMCMSFADKIPAKSVHRLIGGNAANLAVGTSRLKLKTAHYLELGDDEPGSKIFNILKSEGVSTKYIQRKKGLESNFSAVLNYQVERTILVYHVKRNYVFPAPENAKWVYYTSMGDGFEKIHPALLRYLKKSGAKLGINPGTFQLRAGIKALKEILRRTDVMLLNKEETQAFTGSTSNDFKVLLDSLLKLGPKIAVITDGPNGSYATDGKDYFYQNIYDTPIFERTGCGDSYSTGFLACLAYGGDMKEAMRWGTMNAAFVIQKTGAQPGLLTLAQMKKLLAANPKFAPRKMSGLNGNYTRGYKPLLLLKNF